MYENEFYDEEQPFTKVDKLTNDLLNAIRKEAENSVDEDNRLIREQNKSLKSQVEDLKNQVKELKDSLNNSIINEELCDIGRIIMSKEYDMDKYDELFSLQEYIDFCLQKQEIGDDCVMKKEKQIEEMARIMCCGCTDSKECMHCLCADWYNAEALYDAGYRKQ